MFLSIDIPYFKLQKWHRDDLRKMPFVVVILCVVFLVMNVSAYVWRHTWRSVNENISDGISVDDGGIAINDNVSDVDKKYPKERDGQSAIASKKCDGDIVLRPYIATSLLPNNNDVRIGTNVKNISDGDAMVVDREITLLSGGTLYTILRDGGISDRIAYLVTNAVNKVYKLSNLRAGTIIKIKAHWAQHNVLLRMDLQTNKRVIVVVLDALKKVYKAKIGNIDWYNDGKNGGVMDNYGKVWRDKRDDYKKMSRVEYYKLDSYKKGWRGDVMHNKINNTDNIVPKSTKRNIGGNTTMIDVATDKKIINNINNTNVKTFVATGLLSDTFQLSAKKAGIPYDIVNESAELLRHSIDMQHDVKAGGAFKIIYSTHLNVQRKNDLNVRQKSVEFNEGGNVYDENGKNLNDDGDDDLSRGTKNDDLSRRYNGSYNKLLYVSVSLKNFNKLEIFRHDFSNGRHDYFRRDGTSVRGAMLRTPVTSAVLSSKYGMRRHPVFGYSKMHTGVDYRAPLGTAVFAAANGVVTKIGFNRGHGRTIVITHNNRYDTMYAHLSKYAENINVGKKVLQGTVIGAVGRSGLATGPHLHFELHDRGAPIDPSKAMNSINAALAPKQLIAFKNNKRNIDLILSRG